MYETAFSDLIKAGSSVAMKCLLKLDVDNIYIFSWRGRCQSVGYRTNFVK